MTRKLLDNDWALSYNTERVTLYKSVPTQRQDLDQDDDVTYGFDLSIEINLKEKGPNYFAHFWKFTSKMNELIDHYYIDNLLDFIRYIEKNLKLFPGLTMNSVNELINTSIEIRKEQNQNKNESLKEKSIGWELDSNYAYVYLIKKEKHKNYNITYKILGKITPDESLPMFFVSITKDSENDIEKLLYEEFNNIVSLLVFLNKNKDKFPEINNNLLDLFITYRKNNSRMNEASKSFNNLSLTQEKIEDFLNESLDDNVILDETNLKDLLMAAGVLGLSTAGVYQGAQELDKMLSNNKPEISQSQSQNHNQNIDILKVPDYKDMPNLWDNEQKQDKVSIDSELNQDNEILSTNKWTNEVWKDAEGKEFSLDDAINFLVDFESFSSKAYRDGYVRNSKGQKVPRYSIGYGTLAPNNSPKDTITRDQAKEAMINHIKKHILPKYRHLTFPSQNQFNSAVSFTYNTGKIPPLNNQGEIDWGRFTSYNNFKGKENDALRRRRNAEFFSAQLMDV